MSVAPRRNLLRPSVVVLAASLAAVGGAVAAYRGPARYAPDRPEAAAYYGRPSPLPLPSQMTVPEYEEKLFAFLNDRGYVALGWLRDKAVRDTGPFLDGKSYGTHPAVRVYYSPGIIRWLEGGRVGTIPDGEMIIKEQYPAPAVRHSGKTEEQLRAALESWTVMVKDSAGSQDGWFWSNPASGQCVVDNRKPPFDYPISGFGLYCVRCHAATKSPGAETTDRRNEFTFAALRNIVGYPGEPILFRVDDSWRKDAKEESLAETHHDSHPKCARPKPQDRPAREPSDRFLKFFDSIRPARLADVAALPPVTDDRVVASRDPHQQFVSSEQCMNCHAGLVAPFGPSMFVPFGKSTDYGADGWDVSPHGEWRWSPMGLAGRDPVFFAQLESEMRHIAKEFDPANAKDLSAALTDTCLRCHGAMGKRQFDHDHPAGDRKFTVGHALAPAGHADAKYGALARDGVGCAVCHRMQPPEQPAGDDRPYLQYFLETTATGRFALGKPGEIYGPFKDDEIAPYAMEHATGLKPRHSDFVKSSRLCASCHTVALPAIDQPLGHGHTADELNATQTVEQFKNFHHHIEQSTYLEWLNSEYENEVNPKNPKAKSCQDCHMAEGLQDGRHGLDLPQIATRIAAVQDATYPDAENLAPHKELDVRHREQGYRRHNFSGLNVFLVELFNQFDDVLGVRTTDFMTGSKQDARNAVADMVRRAREETADVQVEAGWSGAGQLEARVTVTNKTGHRFPSGVGFRRAFLEFQVVELPEAPGGVERVVWSSGRANELGVLVGPDGQPLPTEFFTRDGAGDQQYQKHHEVITSPNQVQVYETLLRDAKGNFSTSFVHGCNTVKDNRLLPRGWKRDGPGGGLTGRYLQATHPAAEAAADPRYTDGSGTDQVTYQVELPDGVDRDRLEVRAALYYQAMPPYFLRNLFTTAPDGPATRRLHALTSHANFKDTPVEGWKLLVGRATGKVPPK